MQERDSIAPWHFIERSGNGIAFRAIHIEGKEEAPNAPTPITNYALFRDGEYITNEQMNDKKSLKLRIRKLVSLGKIQNYMKDFEILLMNKRKKV